jgi:adenosylhomocysteine nucleosidase
VATELTCILFALDREAMAFRRSCAPWRRIRGAPVRAWLAGTGAQRVLVMITGMGAAATERALAWALGEDNPCGRPTLIISAGFCGALIGDLAVGDVIRADEVIDTTGGSWVVMAIVAGQTSIHTCMWPCAPASAKPQAAETTKPLRLLSVSAPILTAEERLALHDRYAAVAVDMESARAACCCAEAGVPFVSIRAVSDGLDTPVSADLSAALAGERISLPRLAFAVACRPALVVELARLARQSRMAAQSLATGLMDLLAREVTTR